MEYKTTKWLIIGGVLITLAIAGTYFYNQYQKLLDYCYKIRKFTLNKINKDNISFTLIIAFQNKSKINFSLTGYNLDFYLNNRKIANLKSAYYSELLAESIAEIPLKVSVETSKIFNISEAVKLAAFFLTDKSKIEFKIEGTVSGKLGNYFLELNNIPIKLGVYNLQELMEAPKTESKCNI